MKKQFLPIVFLSLTLLLSSCGSSNNRFRVKGRLLHFNQGIFLVYSPEGVLDGIDTISVEGGRFVWETTCEEPTTLIMVLPNFSEQPIFAQPGAKITIEGDASRLSELEITGTKENKRMTAFRRQIVKASPPEVRRLAAEFIKAHPETAVAKYLLIHYFVETDSPDYGKALQLLAEIKHKRNDTIEIASLEQSVREQSKILSTSTLPPFSTKDINGQVITSADLHRGVTLIYTWASWNYESQNIQRRINTLRSENGKSLNIVAISLDADIEECRKIVEREVIRSRQICDGEHFLSPLIKQLGFNSVNDNLLLVDGKIVKRNIATDKLTKEVEKFLKN